MKKKYLFFAFLFSLISCTEDNMVFEKSQQKSKDLSTLSQNRTEIAFPNQKGIAKEGTFNGIRIKYDQYEHANIFQGDIILSNKQLQNKPGSELLGTGRTEDKWPRISGVSKNFTYRVYYSIAPDLVNSYRVDDAIAHWEQNTRLRFIPRTNQTDYIVFTTGSGCASNIGRIGGVQYIFLSPLCSVGNTIHEIGHAVGLWHEHMRKDRDQFVTINWSNIASGAVYNFETYEALGLDGFDYNRLDFSSIMMYDSYAFSKNGNPTIVKANGTTFSTQRTELSNDDIATVSYMYPQYDWKLLPGEGTDIGVGANGSTYVVGNALGGYKIYKWNGSGWSQIPFNGQGSRIAVDPSGNAWVIDRNRKIFKQAGNSWVQLPGEATDIGVGADGSTYIVGNALGGYKIYKLNGSDWDQVSFSGQGLRIDVDPSGNPWVINRSFKIHKRNTDGTWSQLPGEATDIGVGTDGLAYIIGNADGPYGIYKWDQNNWLRMPGGGRNIDAGINDQPWITDATNKLYIFDF